jgi:hypothetical protein
MNLTSLETEKQDSLKALSVYWDVFSTVGEAGRVSASTLGLGALSEKPRSG